MAEHNDHGFMATKENAAPLKAATIERAMAISVEIKLLYE